MSKSQTVDVYVGLPHGIILGAIDFGNGMAYDSARTLLEHGINECPRDKIERWLQQNKNLSCVKRGQVRILDGDRLAVDSSKRK